MMEFKHCKYYEQAIEQEHCAFECICTDDCYFTRPSSYQAQELTELSSEIKDLQRILNESEMELNNYSETIKNLKEENRDLTDTIIQILKDKKS